MYKTVEAYKRFFEFLYKKPKEIYQENDVILSTSKEQNAKEEKIYYTDEIKNIFDTQIFRRIDKIFQLGTEIFLEHSLIHTRGEHSKGTYARTLDFMMSLCQKENIRSLIEKNSYEKYVLAELVRALLHDIGHGPFSHTMETVCNLPKGFHEEIGKRMIEENEELVEVLNNIYSNMPQILKEVEDKNFLGLNSMFEGQFDVDRADFIPRDNYFAGKNHREMAQIVKELLESVDIKKINIDGKTKIVPVFPYNQLKNIEKFLSCRFYNYKNFYYSSQGKLYEYIFKEFANNLLECDEDYDLKTFLQNNINKKPEEIDLEEYIRFNDIEFFKGIVEVYKNTNNKRLKQLSKLCIPNKFMVPSIYYGLMASKEKSTNGQDTMMDEESEELLLQMCKIDRNDTKNMTANTFKILSFNSEQDLRNFIENIKKILSLEGQKSLENYGILQDCSKNYLYKNKPEEEIYISDEEGKVYAYDKYPGRTLNLEQFTNIIVVFDYLKLQEAVKDENLLKQIMNLFVQEESVELSEH